MLRDTDQQVLDDLTEWGRRFQQEAVSIVGLRKPKLESGEHWAVRTLKVGISQRDPQVAPEEWGARPGSTGLLGHEDGAAYATNRRAFVANGPKVKQEWRWDELFAVRVLGNWRGVMLMATPGAPEVDVLVSEWNRAAVASTPDLRKVAVGWLKFEGAFAAHRGELAAWLERLPRRLAAAGGQSGN